MAMVRGKNLELVNVDITIHAQAPKLAPYIARMRANLAEAMGVDLDRVSVKAKSEEGLGPVGRGESITAWAAALLE
jgi:2-C-methyl-D-erythritol 2,4-cyclodiphosphate synthase